MRAIAVIDGEHYAPVVRDALAGAAATTIVGCVLVGGTEKLRGGEDYGVPLAASLEAAIAEHAPDVVLDLSDEPVLGPPARLRLAARALALGVPYEGADFRFDPPRFEPIATPSLAVIGTGKRVGKTAVTGHVGSRRLARDRERRRRRDGTRRARRSRSSSRCAPTVADLLALSRAGTSCCVGPPRDGGADGRADRRLPPLRRRAGGRGRASRTSSPAPRRASSSTPT